MTPRNVPLRSEDRLLEAIDELFRSLDDETARVEQCERERSQAYAEALQRRLALAFHDLGVGDLTGDWVSAADGRLMFADLDRRRAERLTLALEHLARKAERFYW